MSGAGPVGLAAASAAFLLGAAVVIVADFNFEVTLSLDPRRMPVTIPT